MPPSETRSSTSRISSTCRQFMVELRWPDGNVKCPQCGSHKVCYLTKNRVWKCYAIHAKPRFTLKTGTIFEGLAHSLGEVAPSSLDASQLQDGISSWELHRALGVTQKTAWFMLHRSGLPCRARRSTSSVVPMGPLRLTKHSLVARLGNACLEAQTVGHQRPSRPRCWVEGSRYGHSGARRHRSHGNRGRTQ